MTDQELKDLREYILQYEKKGYLAGVAELIKRVLILEKIKERGEKMTKNQTAKWVVEKFLEDPHFAPCPICAYRNVVEPRHITECDNIGKCKNGIKPMCCVEGIAEALRQAEKERYGNGKYTNSKNNC